MSILKVGSQHYRVFLHLWRDADGRQLRRSETVKGTRAEAERREREARRALDTGTFVDPGAGTVAELMTRWLESINDKKSERSMSATSSGAQPDRAGPGPHQAGPAAAVASKPTLHGLTTQVNALLVDSAEGPQTFSAQDVARRAAVDVKTAWRVIDELSGSGR